MLGKAVGGNRPCARVPACLGWRRQPRAGRGVGLRGVEFVAPETGELGVNTSIRFSTASHRELDGPAASRAVEVGPSKITGAPINIIRLGERGGMRAAARRGDVGPVFLPPKPPPIQTYGAVRVCARDW